MLSGDLQEADKIRLRREAKKNRGFYVEDEAQLVFVIRIRGINDMAPKVSDVASVVFLHRDVCRVAGTRKVHVRSKSKCSFSLMQSRKILQLLRLRQIHNGVFVKVCSEPCCLAAPLVSHIKTA